MGENVKIGLCMCYEVNGRPLPPDLTISPKPMHKERLTLYAIGSLLIILGLAFLLYPFLVYYANSPGYRGTIQIGYSHIESPHLEFEINTVTQEVSFWFRSTSYRNDPFDFVMVLPYEALSNLVDTPSGINLSAIGFMGENNLIIYGSRRGPVENLGDVIVTGHMQVRGIQSPSYRGTHLFVVPLGAPTTREIDNTLLEAQRQNLIHVNLTMPASCDVTVKVILPSEAQIQGTIPEQYTVKARFLGTTLMQEVTVHTSMMEPVSISYLMPDEVHRALWQDIVSIIILSAGIVIILLARLRRK